MKKIAYLTTYDAHDMHAWSGLGNRIARALAGAGHPVEFIGDLRARSVLADSRKLANRVFSAATYRADRDALTLRRVARQAERRLSGLDVDVLVSPGTLAVAELATDRPILIWTDATFAGMLDYYPSFTNLSRRSIRDGHRAEAAALSKAAAVVYSSEWAARSAIEHYDVDPATVSVVAFGAIGDPDADARTALRPTAAKRGDVCQLLFVGVDWQRKGGELALAVTAALNDQGIPTELHVVGCDPPRDAPAFVRRYGFLSKKNPGDAAVLAALFAESHFLIVPSTAECFGLVFAEASSAGLPSIASDEGGIPDAIREGVNGAMFAKTEHPSVIADYIQNLLGHPDAYERLAASSFTEYQNRLNWQTAGAKVSRIIEGLNSAPNR